MPENTPYPGETAAQFAARQRVRAMQTPVVYVPKASQYQSAAAQAANVAKQPAAPAQPVQAQEPVPVINNTLDNAKDIFGKQQAYAANQQRAKMAQPATPAQPAQPAQAQQPQNQLTPEQQAAQDRVTPPKGRTPGEQQEYAMTNRERGSVAAREAGQYAMAEGAGAATEGAATAGAEVGMSSADAGASVLVDAAGNPVATSATQAGGEAAAEGATTITASNILGAAAAIYAGYTMYENYGERKPVSGAVAGATMGYYVAGPYGAVVGAVIGGLIGNVKAGKHEDQVNRDRFRKGMQELGLTDEDHLIKFSDGTVFDMGKDGGNRLVNVDGSTRRFYEVDQKNKFSHQAVGWTNPLAVILAGGNVKLTNDFAAYFANAVLSNSETLEDVRMKVIEMYQEAGISPEQFGIAINDLQKKGLITADEAAALLAGAASVYTPNSGIEMSIEEFIANAPPTGAGTQETGAFTPDAYEKPAAPPEAEATEPVPDAETPAEEKSEQ